MDVLREATEDELSFVVGELRKNIPAFIKDLHYILGAQRSKAASKDVEEFSDRILPKFYVPINGLKGNCTVFGITGGNDHVVWFFSQEDSLSEVKQCLEQTKLIRWTDKILFVTLHRRHAEAVLDCIARNGYNLVINEEASYYWIPQEEAMKFLIELPQGTFLKPLEEAETEFCNSIWEWRDDNSELFIRSLIKANGGVALCDEKTGEILSFALINEQLAVGILNTVKSARGKGYAEVVAKSLSKSLAEKFKLNPTCFINSENPSSIRLFLKIGFEKIGDCNWIVVGNNKR